MKIIAHRGASGYAPENTIVAFQTALDQGVDGIELDVRLTKDHVLVVCHDANIRRTSDGKGRVQDMTLEELKSYDFGSWFDPEFAGEKIPTLEEALRFLQDEDILLNIEIKNGPRLDEGIEEEVVRLVKKYDFRDNVLITAFNHLSLLEVHKLDPELKIAFILHTNLIDPFHYIEHSGIKPYTIHPNYQYITQEMVDEAHRRGIKVLAATVDDKAFGDRFKEMGIDYLLTNKTRRFLN